MEKFYITEHAYKRTKERCGWNKATTDRMLQKVRANGTVINDTSGKIKPWAQSYLSKEFTKESRIFGNWLYLITDNRLITVYQVPTKIRVQKTKQHTGKLLTA